MILIADSGSTKTNWFLCDEKVVLQTGSTKGINPFFRTSEDIYTELQDKLFLKYRNKISDVFFYGAGIIDERKRDIVRNALSQLWPSARIEIFSDLLAAARSTLGRDSGIACIIGTGSNSCLYNGETIVRHVPSLGYILGDEGSGAYLGRRLLGDYLKKIMPADLRGKFNEKYNLKYTDFLDFVYNQAIPNKFLAQFVPFLHENMAQKYCTGLVQDAFYTFLTRNVKLYPNYRDLKINFVGSVAWYFKEQLEVVLKENQLNPGEIVQEPSAGLIQFHLSK